jgi:nicotinamidase/pyrazinamidase
MTSEALVLTDIQNDFLPGGTLAVPDGDAIVPVANRLSEAFDLVVATQDWHPPDHVSFAQNHDMNVGEVIEVAGLEQRLWPVHCVQDTNGAEPAPGLDTSRIAQRIHKGVDQDIDSYSTFFDNGHCRATGLHQFLQEHGVKRVYLCGLATDYCVKFSALDARRLDYETFVIIDACRGIEAVAGDIERAVEEMRRAGIVIVSSDDVLKDRVGR